MQEMILELLQKYSWLIGVLAILGIEIAPIKIAPIKWLWGLILKGIKKINNTIHHDMNETLNTIVDRLDKMEKSNDMKDVMEIKNKLCTYKVTLQTTGLDEFQFNRCFELIEQYRYYQNKYPNEVNGHVTAIINYIEKQYEIGNVLESGIDSQNDNVL